MKRKMNILIPKSLVRVGVWIIAGLSLYLAVSLIAGAEDGVLLNINSFVKGSDASAGKYGSIYVTPDEYV